MHTFYLDIPLETQELINRCLTEDEFWLTNPFEVETIGPNRQIYQIRSSEPQLGLIVGLEVIAPPSLFHAKIINESWEINDRITLYTNERPICEVTIFLERDNSRPKRTHERTFVIRLPDQGLFDVEEENMRFEVRSNTDNPFALVPQQSYGPVVNRLRSHIKVLDMLSRMPWPLPHDSDELVDTDELLRAHRFYASRDVERIVKQFHDDAYAALLDGEAPVELCAKVMRWAATGIPDIARTTKRGSEEAWELRSYTMDDAQIAEDAQELLNDTEWRLEKALEVAKERNHGSYRHVLADLMFDGDWIAALNQGVERVFELGSSHGSLMDLLSAIGEQSYETALDDAIVDIYEERLRYFDMTRWINDTHDQNAVINEAEPLEPQIKVYLARGNKLDEYDKELDEEERQTLLDEYYRDRDESDDDDDDIEEEEEQEEDGEEDEENEEDVIMHKSTFVIWTTYDAQGVPLEDLAREADCGDARCSYSEHVSMPWEKALEDETWDDGNTTFFSVDDEI